MRAILPAKIIIRIIFSPSVRERESARNTERRERGKEREERTRADVRPPYLNKITAHLGCQSLPPFLSLLFSFSATICTKKLPPVRNVLRRITRAAGERPIAIRSRCIDPPIARGSLRGSSPRQIEIANVPRNLPELSVRSFRSRFDPPISNDLGSTLNLEAARIRNSRDRVSSNESFHYCVIASFCLFYRISLHARHLDASWRGSATRHCANSVSR